MPPTPQRKTIAALTHGSYLLDSGQNPEGAPLLVGCHGYGENAERHLAELRRIPGIERWVVCAVEGLHRFYNPKTQEVLSSWMTREQRELAIADNVRYVASVVEEVRREQRTGDTLVFAGFSQGVAMAWRAAVLSGLACDGLIALAGDVPPDVAAHRRAALPAILLGRGEADAWYDAAKMQADLDTLAARGAQVETFVFPEGHVWTDAFRARAGEFLERLAR